MLLAHSVAASAGCDAPNHAIANAALTAQKQLQLAWAPVPGATGYRLRLLSRVPNGKIIASHDTGVVAPRFLPPQSLAEHRAKASIRVSAICGDEISTESASWFVIDTSPTCKLEDLEATAVGGKARLHWKPVTGAQIYDVRAHALGDGRLIASREAQSPSAQLELREAAVISVRPNCTSGLGEAVYRVVAAD